MSDNARKLKLFKTAAGALRTLGNTLALGLQEVRTGSEAPVSVVDVDGVPVAWRLFGFGPFSITRDGLTYEGEFTPDHAEEILAYHEQKGNRIPIDSEHYLYRLSEKLGVDEADVVAVLMDKRAAMAFGRLEIREDGLWIVDVEWSDIAHQLMAEDLFRWYSPVLRGLVDGRLRITSVAMTNSPAIDQLDAIAATAEAAADGEREWAVVALSDLSRAIEPATRKEQKVKELLAMLGALIGIDAVALSDDGSAPADVMTKLGELSGELTGLRTLKGTHEAFMGVARDALALGADADTKIVEGALLGLKAKGDQADALKLQVDALALESETRKKQEVVEGGVKAGKLTPHMVENWCKDVDAAALSAFLEHAPVIVPTGGPIPRSTLPEGGKRAPSGVESEVGRALGFTGEEMAEAVDALG